MKKLVIAALTVTCAVSVFAQGTVVFNNRVTGTVVTHVYGNEVRNSQETVPVILLLAQRATPG